MRLFGRGEKKSGTGRTVAEAAIAGASREELIQAAMQQLRDHVRADRLGVWLAEASGPGDFRGIVWDSQQELTPASWTRLTPEISYFLKPLTAAERSEEHTSELQSLAYLVCRLLLEKKKINNTMTPNLHHTSLEPSP